MPLQATGDTVRKARSASMPEVSRGKVRSGQGRLRRDGGVTGTPLEKQKERERGRRGGKREEKLKTFCDEFPLLQISSC